LALFCVADVSSASAEGVSPSIGFVFQFTPKRITLMVMTQAIILRRLLACSVGIVFANGLHRAKPVLDSVSREGRLTLSGFLVRWIS